MPGCLSCHASAAHAARTLAPHRRNHIAMNTYDIQVRVDFDFERVTSFLNTTSDLAKVRPSIRPPHSAKALWGLRSGSSAWVYYAEIGSVKTLPSTLMSWIMVIVIVGASSFAAAHLGVVSDEERGQQMYKVLCSVLLQESACAYDNILNKYSGSSLRPFFVARKISLLCYSWCVVPV